MKLERSFLFFAIMACTLLFASCNKNDGFDIDDDTNLEVGIHKYVIEVTGNDEVMQVISIVGNTPTGVARLYDENGEYIFIHNRRYYKSIPLSLIKDLNIFTFSTAVLSIAN